MLVKGDSKLPDDFVCFINNVEIVCAVALNASLGDHLNLGIADVVILHDALQLIGKLKSAHNDCDLLELFGSLTGSLEHLQSK